VASFHSKEAREHFLELKVLRIGKAEVHVAPFPAQKQQIKGAKYIISGVPMEATGQGVQESLHSLSVERFIIEKYDNTQVRTGRVIFWTTEKVPTTLYIGGHQVPVKRVASLQRRRTLRPRRPKRRENRRRDPRTNTHRLRLNKP